MTGIAIFSVIVGISPAQQRLGAYLAGLIEGDGSIKVPDNRISASGRWRYPTITITFAAKDLPLAQLLASIFLGKIAQGGTKANPGNWYVLTINRLASIYVIIILINGKMRTPKIEALHRLISWFNAYILESGAKQSFAPLTALPLDTSLLSSNGWLAGLLDADSNFYLTFQLNADSLATQVQLYMRLSQRQEYSHRESALPTSYVPIMQSIAAFLSASFSVYTRERANNTENGCLLVAKSAISRQALIDYLSEYPLLSSKRLDYLDWVSAHNMRMDKVTRTLDGTASLQSLKSGMNDTRTRFDWSHLDSLRKEASPKA